MAKINLEIKNGETILEFFERNCNDNGFNVSKIIKYLEFIDDYLHTIIDNNNGEIAEDLVEEIFDFGNYFFQNYGEDTKEKRLMTFGVNDSYVLSLYINISRECCLDEYEEKLNSLTIIEQRKIKRVTEQLLNLEGNISYILLEVDEETEEDLDPLIIPYYKDMDENTKKTIEEMIQMELMDLFTFKGLIICVVERDVEKLAKNECKNIVFGIAFNEKEIGLITAQKMVSTFSLMNEDFIDNLSFNGEDEIEFVDADTYINPLGMTRNQYNQLGEKLPNRKGRKINDNVIPFTSIIKKTNK